MCERKTGIGRQFSRSANGSYDVHARVQRNMAKLLASSLKQWTKKGDKDELSILEIGCGTGKLTELLKREWPNASIIAIDMAPAMIKAAEERIGLGSTNSRIHFLLGDAELWAANAPASSFDLVISNACFQWFSDPKRTLEHLERLLRADGLLAFATFGPNTFHELHTSFDEAYQALGTEPQRHGLSFLSADQWREYLIEAGFSAIRQEPMAWSEKYPSVRDFLYSVKAQGASASEAAQYGRNVSRHLFSAMYKAYENRFSVPGGVKATYDVLFVKASKG
nr:malonyl-ACP O-methyltransferase BioC [Paenibacillus sp. ATY16]